MTYTTPATPIAGTAITVAFYGTNIRDNISHLRGILPDPGGSNRVLVGTGSTTAVFSATPTLTTLTTSGLITSNGGLTVFGATALGATNVDSLQVANVPIRGVAQGTYTGNGGTSARQITTGFVPKGVLIVGGDNTADLDCAIVTSTSGALRFIQASPVTYTTAVKLRADDGFTVADGNDFCNQNARTYRWAAFG